MSKRTKEQGINVTVSAIFIKEMAEELSIKLPISALRKIRNRVEAIAVEFIYEEIKENIFNETWK